MSKAVRTIGALLCAMLLSATVQAGPILSEGFDNISLLGAAGWAGANNSSPLGATDWFQGNPGVFSAHSGAAGSYLAANFNSAGFGGNISLWGLTPELPLSNGDVLAFYTRTETGAPFPDRLEVRMSTNGASTNVGSTDTSVGDFSILLLTINPALGLGGYPEDWTEFAVTVGGLSGPTTGRFAFRYFVTDTSLNGDYIGIDDVSVTAAVPEPATMVLLGTGLVGLVARRRRSR